ncbi:MAG TPA: addiction module protein [Kiritimatiellia bacterium]|nr:addiction module protein [Kiritimatiellia bacterium]HMP96634.1 addiction module protein [Kiritimatiellia bacterium]
MADIMHLTIPLHEMTAADKLQAIEEIWADLARESRDVPSPTWHGDVLRAREQRVADGTARFLDIDDAKQAVRKQINESPSP